MIKFVFPLAGLYILLVISNCLALPFLNDAPSQPESIVARANPVQSIVDEFKKFSECTLLSNDAIKHLKGWKLLNDYADKHWGKGDRAVRTYDSHYPNRKTQICLINTVEMEYDGEPQCTTANASTAGVFAGATGTITDSVLVGLIVSGQVSVTDIKYESLGTAIMLNFNYPSFGGVMPAMTYSETYSSSQTKSYTVSKNNQITETVLMSAIEGETCYINVSVHTCIFEAKGKLKMVVPENSTAWIEYEDKLEPHDHPAGDDSKHYKFAYSFAHLQEDDRSGYVEFSGQLKSVTRSNYEGYCKNVTFNA
ncbi:hypothetical protein FB446DRAFT_752963 [Lentinula raphanica]|nr:hypothetical protein FB446DRAFT_752963 [Lentinula raphanica]